MSLKTTAKELDEFLTEYDRDHPVTTMVTVLLMLAGAMALVMGAMFALIWLVTVIKFWTIPVVGIPLILIGPGKVLVEFRRKKKLTTDE